ncbi:hypothetical protein APICC_02704 [Apis cerana cerana]|uniref:Uncharacterized protein n=1 Tax=Apis cerana cerana TaxID=94128 RepID=A0A2A3EAD6_APICC|nr:hypothetical protein APICC_02704 [Apis cerana cerana]
MKILSSDSEEESRNKTEVVSVVEENLRYFYIIEEFQGLFINPRVFIKYMKELKFFGMQKWNVKESLSNDFHRNPVIRLKPNR